MPQIKKSIKVKWFASRNKYYVCFAHTPERWIASDITIKSEQGALLAQQWAKLHEQKFLATQPKAQTFASFASGFFDQDRELYKLNMAKGRLRNGNYYKTATAWLNNYILPGFGQLPIDSISAMMIDDWLIGLQGKNVKELSRASKNRIIEVFRLVMSEAKRQRLISYNPLDDIKPFAEQAERAIFTKEEISQLFPSDTAAMLRIWLTPMWCAWACIMRDTGHRPSEQIALTWQDYHHIHGVHGFVINKKYDAGFKTVISGTKSGKDRATLISSQSIYWLAQWQEQSPRKAPQELIFFSTQGKNDYIQVESANKHFVAALHRAGIEPRGRTQYCLRHTLNTQLKALLGHSNKLRALMGHSSESMTNNYNHPTPEHLFSAISDMGHLIDGVFSLS